MKRLERFTVPSGWSQTAVTSPGFASIVLLFFFQITWFGIIFVKILEYPGTLSKSVYCSYDLSWSSSNQGRYLQQNLAPLLNDSHRMDLAISTKKRKEPQPVNLSAPANKCQCGHVSILATPRVESAANMLEDHSKRSPWQLEVGLEIHLFRGCNPSYRFIQPGVMPPFITGRSQSCLSNPLWNFRKGQKTEQSSIKSSLKLQTEQATKMHTNTHRIHVWHIYLHLP